MASQQAEQIHLPKYRLKIAPNIQADDPWVIVIFGCVLSILDLLL